NEDSGKLSIYSSETSVGTVAKRVFLDEKGRDWKVIHYRRRWPWANGKYPPRPRKNLESLGEKDLEAVFVRIRLYDEMGRVRRVENRSPEMVLLGTWDTLYSGDAKTSVHRTSVGIRTYEVRRIPGREVSHLYFDDSGERLVALKGLLPDDVDLADGWGEDTGGLACGIGVNRTQGTLGDISVSVTINNRTGHDADIVSCRAYHVLQVELRNAGNSIVQQDVEKLSERDAYLTRINSYAKENMQTLRPNCAATYENFELGDWYSDLPADTYYLTVKRRAAEKGFVLTSNTLKLAIQDSGAT
ncbi:MAG: hypothetical protein L3K26_14150, partial [Candidatus Hydrogenedentes bacterium]|nr:hypothetical protein [Candidatus Hydrogenedentota bacterium]